MESSASTWSPAKHGGGTAQARLSAQAQARPRCTDSLLAVSGAGELKAGAMVEKEEAGGGGGGGISEEEAAQYDRQIRLWGLEAQKR